MFCHQKSKSFFFNCCKASWFT